MRKIIRDEAPDFWKKFVRRYPKVTYDAAGKTKEGQSAIRNLREYMVLQQKYLCCYCCNRIDISKNSSHNEHIRPRSKFPRDSMRYDNLLASCCISETCGMYKDNDFDEQLFVSPLQDDCERHFRFQADGYVKGLTDQGKYTINLLNLNSSRLVNARRTLYNECCEMAEGGCADYIEEEYIREKDGKLPIYVDMVQYFQNIGEFAALSPDV